MHHPNVILGSNVNGIPILSSSIGREAADIYHQCPSLQDEKKVHDDLRGLDRPKFKSRRHGIKTFLVALFLPGQNCSGLFYAWSRQLILVVKVLVDLKFHL